jgi:hypothetical protein
MAIMRAIFTIIVNIKTINHKKLISNDILTSIATICLAKCGQNINYLLKILEPIAILHAQLNVQFITL